MSVIRTSTPCDRRLPSTGPTSWSGSFWHAFRPPGDRLGVTGRAPRPCGWCRSLDARVFSIDKMLSMRQECAPELAKVVSGLADGVVGLEIPGNRRGKGSATVIDRQPAEVQAINNADPLSQATPGATTGGAVTACRRDDHAARCRSAGDRARHLPGGDVEAVPRVDRG